MKRGLFLLALAFTIVTSAWAYVAGLDGKWTGSIDINGQEVPVAYNFKLTGDKVTGTSESPYGIASVDDGKIKGDSILFNCTVNGMVVPHRGKIYADSIGMTVEVQGSNFHAALLRTK